MPKLKHSLLSLGAHGTVGDTLTFQKRGRDTIARTKPVPAQPNTLAQMYQRWDYQDQLYLWHQLSAAQKQQYQTDASRYHMTGFAYWMRLRLKTLPDIVVRYRMDHSTSTTELDYSKNDYHATKFGVVNCDAVIDGGYLFDGIDDRITPATSFLAPLTVWTCEFWYLYIATKKPLISLGHPVTEPFIAANETGDRPLLALAANLYRYWQRNPVNTIDGNWHLLHFLIPGAAQADIDNCLLYADNQLMLVSSTTVLGLQLAKGRLSIGGSGGYYHNCRIDHFTIYNRLLDATERQRHYERSYPL